MEIVVGEDSTQLLRVDGNAANTSIHQQAMGVKEPCPVPNSQFRGATQQISPQPQERADDLNLTVSPFMVLQITPNHDFGSPLDFVGMNTPCPGFDIGGETPFKAPTARFPPDYLNPTFDANKSRQENHGDRYQTIATPPIDFAESSLDILTAIRGAVALPAQSNCFLEVPVVSHAQIYRFWEVYFDQFHQVSLIYYLPLHPRLICFYQRFPIIHRPSTRIEKCHPLLISAITAIGASFSSDPQDTEYYVCVLARLCTIFSHVSFPTDLLFKAAGMTMQQPNPSLEPECGYGDPLRLLICQCLIYFFILTADAHACRPWAMAGQSTMVARARRLSVFRDQHACYGNDNMSSPSNISTVDCSLSAHELLDQDDSDEAIHKQWPHWIEKESQQRLGWAIVVRLHTLTNDANMQ